MRASILPGVLAWLLGCHGGGAVGDGGTDLATPGDGAGAPADLAQDAGFCGAPRAARVQLNGTLSEGPATKGKALVLNCCDAATLSVTGAGLATPLTVMWRHQLTGGPDLPVTLDLARLPANWTVTLYSGCDPTTPGCVPSDRYDSGLSGTLALSRAGAGYEMTACVQASESAAAPHAVIHALRLWAPGVTASW